MDSPPSGEHGDVTQLLQMATGGDSAAEDLLFRAVLQQLRGMASSLMRHERHDHTLSVTAVVSETYLKLFRPGGAAGPTLTLTSRRAFFHAAAMAMRRLLIDHARTRNRLRRGGGAGRAGESGRRRLLRPIPDDAIHAATQADPEDLLALDELLDHLQAADGRAAEVVRLKFFAGLSQGQISELLEISEKTVQRDWDFGLAFMADAARA
ncbi:MAG: ECF-type sigma factor [bacterium]|jgi:RNA polymerase sigma-70 factor (ECF subfamily)|nr:hypothetical protein [Phycisphaerales bacterium]MCE2652762.1 hypothetical protein [Planctomycetaceae bacterium]